MTKSLPPRPGTVPALAAALAGVATLALVFSPATAATPRGVAVPEVSGPVAVGPASHAWMAAADARAPLDLGARGYVEEEYFFNGTANVYDWAASGEVSIRAGNAPYRTRMLVRRPADARRFSGTVWVEFLNPVARTDMSLAWGYANYYMMDHGDAWVGVTAFGDSLRTLKSFDAKRYASLSMANPAPVAEGCKAAGKDYDAENEDGLRWDILTQAGALLKSTAPGRPLATLKVEQAYVFGQSNGDLPTYISAFHRRASLANGKPVWDGYVLKDSGVPIATNQCDARPAADDARRIFRNVGVPVMFVLVENSTLNGLGSRRPDSDERADRYRRYEIPGSSHVDEAAFPWLPKAEMLKAVGIDPLWPETRVCVPREELSDFPVHYYVAGAMQNLDAWVRKGVAPPRAERIRVTGADTANPLIERDANGNALGGVRNAYVDVPLAAYNQRGPCGGNGVKVPFSWERLDELYGNYRSYARKFGVAVDRDVEQRWVPAAYAARMKAGLTAMPTLDRNTNTKK